MKIAVLFIYALLLSGCTDKPGATADRTASDNNRIAPTAAIYNSVTSRIHEGMSMAEVRALFSNCTRFRSHGPCINTSNGTTTYYEEWTLGIRCSDGDVRIHTTTGRESDLEHGIVKNISYGKKIESAILTNSQKAGPAYPPQGVGSAGP